MKRTAILKSLIFLLCFFSIAYCSAIETLFIHRECLKKRTMAYENQIGPYVLIRKMRHKDLNEWKKRENEIFGAFLNLCDVSTYRPNYHLDDTLLVTLLIETLGKLSPEMNRRAGLRFKRVPYPYLNAQRTKIINQLQRVDDISVFSYVAAVINPPDTMKKQLLASNKLDISLRARLGDKDSENKLIERMDRALKISIGAKTRFGDEEGIKSFIDSINNAAGAHRYRDTACFLDGVIDELLLCGTSECIKTVLNFFAKFQPRLNSSGYVHREQYGTCPDEHELFISSPRELIIMGFRKHHPKLSLLHEEFDSLEARFHGQRQRGRLAEKEIINYMERFLAWGNKEYGTNFKLESKFLFTRQREDKIRDREMKKLREHLYKTDGRTWSLIEETAGEEMFLIKKADGEEMFLIIEK